MPKYARKKSNTGIYHIILRGINKQTIFEDDKDSEKFLSTIVRFKEVCRYEIYGYCFMSNHVHLLIKEGEENISSVVKRICSSYVYWYNWKYNRCGHLFQERFKSEAVENDAYLLTVLRYIHQNPVKAGLVKSAKDYKWSSYHNYIKKQGITDTDFILQILSDSKDNTVVSFIEYMHQKNTDTCLDYEEKIRLSDKEVKNLMSKLGIDCNSTLQRLDKELRNDILRTLKSTKGVSIRQLSRITGISKSVIDRT